MAGRKRSVSIQQTTVSKKICPMLGTIPYLTRLTSSEPIKATRKAKTAIAWIERVEPTTIKEKQLLHMAKLAFEALIMRAEFVMAP